MRDPQREADARLTCPECRTILAPRPGAEHVVCSNCGRVCNVAGGRTVDVEGAAGDAPPAGEWEQHDTPPSRANSTPSGPTVITTPAGQEGAEGEPPLVTRSTPDQKTVISAPPDEGVGDVTGAESPALAAGPETVASGQPDLTADTAESLRWLREELADTYEVIGPVARGGMGAIYKVRHRRLGRVCALKLMLGGALASEHQRRRFEREAQAIAAVQHPAIVPIYEIGAVRGQPYFTMEFVEGQDLLTYARDRALGTRAICELMIEICQAMDFAHAHGIIHRDLKPGNVMVDREGRCRLLDFGLARLAREDEPAASLLTMSGDIMGTPRYMSPEQALGKTKELDGRTDVYSLGVIFYELLLGTIPYDLQGVPGFQALKVLAEAEPVRPTELMPMMSRDLEAILLKTLEKNKKDRYRTAQQLADDIKNYLADRPVTARPSTAVYRLRKHAWRKRRLIMWALVFALVAGILGTLWLVAALARSGQERDYLKWAGGILNIRPKVVALAKDGKWIEAHARAEGAEAVFPDEPTVIGLVREVQRLAELGLGKRSAEVDALIRAQDYEGAEATATELAFWGMRLPFPEVKQAAAAKETSFTEDCWADAQRVLDEAHVCTCEDSVALLENYLSHFGDGPHAGAARKKLDELRGESDGYFIEKRFAAVNRGMRQMQWEEVEGILAGAGTAVEQAAGIDGGQWLERFSNVQQEIDAVIRVASRSRLGFIRALGGYEGMVKGVAFRPGTRPPQVASGGLDKEVVLWDCQTGEALKSLGLPAGVRPLAFSPDGEWLAIGCTDGTVHLWRPDEGEASRHWDAGHSARLECLSFSSDGGRLLSASSDAVKLWDITGKEPTERHELPGAEGPAAFSASGDVLVTVQDDRIGVWDAAALADAPRLLECLSRPRALAISLDGKLLAASHGVEGDRAVTVWDLEQGVQTRTLSAHTVSAEAVAFSPDCRILASGGGDKNIILWDMTAEAGTERPLAFLSGHLKRVNSLSFSPDGKFLVSGSNSGSEEETIRLWGVLPREEPE